MIAVFGSVNLDLVARVARLPRPGETLAGTSFATSPGGKGANQALAARRAGASVALHGAVGDDAFAQPALALLREAGVDVDGVRRVAAATGVALIHVEDSGENAITVIPGANVRAAAGQVDEDTLRRATTLLLQLEVPAGESRLLAKRARGHGARVVLNAAPAMPLDAAWLDALDVLIVNELEAATLAEALSLPGDPDGFAATLARQRAITAIVTLGARGAVAAEAGTRYAVPSLPVQCVDAVGAGDAFVGTFAAALDAGLALPHALARSCAAGALACTHIGAQPSFVPAEALATPAAALESQIEVTPRPTR